MRRHSCSVITRGGPGGLAAIVAALALAACNQDVRTPPTGSAAAPLSLSPAGTPPRLFAGGGSRITAPTSTAAAIAYVARLAPSWGTPGGTAALAPIATVPTGLGDIVRLQQSVDGVTVDGRELRVLIRPDGSLGAASGTAIAADRARRGSFALTPAEAVARAVAVSHGVGPAPTSLAVDPGAVAADEARFHGGPGARPFVERARASKRWYDAGDHLEAAWVVDAESSASDDDPASQAFHTVVSATDGRILARHDLRADEFAYRVWAETGSDQRPLDGPTADFSPHPTGHPGVPLPAFIPPVLVHVAGRNHPAGGGPSDPWLPPGATETLGNHVDVYTDVNAPDGLTAGDFRASATAAGAFDRVYDTAADPLSARSQQEAALTQLFYTLNWLHDDWYDAGFTESAGNAQQDNFGRGGVGGDRLLAEAQDSSGRNNANMTTFPDGMSPKLQVYVFDGHARVTVQPLGLITDGAATRDYGPRSYDLTGAVVAGADDTAPITDGCQALTTAVAGKVVLLDRGQCTIKVKAAMAQAAGASALVVISDSDQTFSAITDDVNVATAITIPVVLVTRPTGVTVRAALAAGPVTVRLERGPPSDKDAALDNATVAHEYGHYLHHRLSNCYTPQCAAMSEGWGDFVALHLMARPGDDLDGAYAYGAYSGWDDPYFGPRRVPYSVDFDRNALTFGHMADGAALPTRHPVNAFGVNSEVHNAGEVWATMLWEAYVALQKSRPSFAEARRAMAEYVVDGLLLAPSDATVTETRDALLLAAHLASPADHAVLAAAFARRGAGSCARSPDRFSIDFTDVREAFDVKGTSQVTAPTLAIDVDDCDGDTALDVGETATVHATIGNTGASDLGPVTVTLASSTPGLTIKTAPIVIASLPPYGSMPVTFTVTLDQARGALAGDLTLTVDSPGACEHQLAVHQPVRLNVDDQPDAATTDSFDADPSVWTATGDGAAGIWSHVRASGLEGVWDGLDGEWAALDWPLPGVTALMSPPMVAGAGPVTITFDHAYDLDTLVDPSFPMPLYFDGMMVEVSTDDGATWTDVGAMAAPGYTGELFVDSGNPLGGRMAYVGRSPGFPTKQQVTLSLGTSLAGKTFRIRFVVATDQSLGVVGWQVDDVAVTGLTNQPFPVQVDDGDACGLLPAEDSGGCCQTGGARSSDLVGALLVLGLVGARRRRRTAAR